MAQYYDPVSHTPLRAISDFGIMSGGVFGAGGQSDTESSVTPIRITGSPGAWVGTQDSSLNVANLDWHGQGETLNWRGPWSRYWWTSGQDHGGRAIYRKGRFWTQAPFTNQIILGCSTVSFGGNKYTTICCTSFNVNGWPILVYQRPFAETYTAHAWPADWTRIGVYTPNAQGLDAHLPGTIFPFNSSGTECQGFFGESKTGGAVALSKRIKITVGEGTASFVEIDNNASNEQPVVETDNSLVNHNVITGTQDPIPCGAISPDATPEYEYTRYGESNEGFTTEITEIDGPFYLAVDYIGDTETLAQYRITEDNSGTAQYTIDEDHHWLNSVVLKQDIDETYNRSGNVDEVIEIISPKVNIKLQDRQETLASNFTSTATVSSPTNYNGSYQNSGTWDQRRLIYMDLRTGSYVYEEGRTEFTETYTVTNEPDLIAVARNKTSYAHNKFIGQLNGTQVVFFEDTPVTTDVDDTADFPTDFNVPVCPSFNGDTSYTNSGAVYKDISATSMFVPEFVLSTVDSTHHATDVAGSTIWSSRGYEYSGGSWGLTGYVNYITGGDVIALLGMVGPNPRLHTAALLDWDDSYGL